ncbi:Trk system potassium uptake protein TrkH [Thalassovita gelatinovora]|uniref:Trk system potassium uptake protein n=1 Tax=Thalassovita gelatinovora TaxID=53501 RepID=A0A0P1FBX3_THAGE|nr:TrkH family potassium uptake protein [Thalassovita gelatinovora]QIZ79977.1 TrkH family potassium uptake protein [Thalassovita gelatinovora]CUH65627.1 Trk system potassium uptake protein TrkH [Thalassovita gelatinovora]SER05987.1 trk system potassium uptake protein TrkH [Thalassovita gelatinovora]
MIDFRPVGYVIGLLVAALGLAMLPPMLVDIAEGHGHWRSFSESAILSVVIGGLTALACRNGLREGLSIQQTFLLTTGVWVALPMFGALPFMLGETEARPVDAFFEAMSGLTTTGATVFTGLDAMPKGLLLWRGILQWLGGIGIIVVAMVFLPELRVGGMQIFRSESFDTMGKILPRATEIASQISVIYFALTLTCLFTYMMLGMEAFDATVHALTTVSTGGFSTHDASFSAFSGPLEYVAAVFMVLAALPFVRYVQMVNGHRTALLRDKQVYGFILVVVALVAFTTLVLLAVFPHHWETSFREAVFNITSIITGTGYASADYMAWGNLLITVFFFTGLIGGCAGSTACSIKIFRYQILLASIKAQLKKTRSPNGVFVPRYDGRKISDDALNSVMSFFVFFLVTLGLLSVVLGMTGLDFITAVSGAASALANIGPGLGDTIGPAGTFADLNDTAKWVLSLAMLIGRLELLVVYAMLTVAFWRG